MVGKLGWFFIFLVIGILCVAVIALAVPPVGDALGGFFGGTVPGVIVGACLGIMVFGTEGFPQFIAVSFGIGIFFIVIWTLFLVKGWNKLRHRGAPTTPSPLGMGQRTMSTQIASGETMQTTPASVATATQTTAKEPETVKEKEEKVAT